MTMTHVRTFDPEIKTELHPVKSFSSLILGLKKGFTM